MSKPHFDRFCQAGVILAAVIVAVFCPTSAIAQVGRTSPALVPATMNRSIQDAMGFQWDVSETGAIKYGTNRCFQMAAHLQVNGSNISPTQKMMTADGKEYVLGWSRSGVQITRRVKVDVKTATMRYVEIFHNPSSTPVTLDVQIITMLRSSLQSVLTDTGRVVSSGSNSQVLASPTPSSGYTIIPDRSASSLNSPGPRSSSHAGVAVLGEKDCGLAITRSSTSYPAVLIYLAGPRSRVKPTLQRQGSYGFVFRYPVTVGPKKTVSVLHGLAQRNIHGTPDAKSLAALFRPFHSREWTRDLPSDVRRSILNGGRAYYVEQTPRGPVLQAAMNLATFWDVKRGARDVLVQDAVTRVSGTVRGGDLTVATRFGKTTVPLEDVAVLIGGAQSAGPSVPGRWAGSVPGRWAMRVHLRGGEILVGPIETEQLTLESDAGLQIELTPKHINALFMHADESDGLTAADAVALLTTLHGDQLALGGESASKIRAVTAWGPIEVAVEQIDCLYPVREPQPMHRLVLDNKSRLSVIIGGGELELNTLRFGAVKIAPGAIARLSTTKEAAAPEEEEDHGDDGDEELAAPHARLAGGNLMVGSVGVDKLSLVVAAGVTSLDTRGLRRMVRLDDQQATDPKFLFELTNGAEVVGRLQDGVFPIRALGRVWNVPAYHLESFQQPLADLPTEPPLKPPLKPPAEPPPEPNASTP